MMSTSGRPETAGEDVELFAALAEPFPRPTGRPSPRRRPAARTDGEAPYPPQEARGALDGHA